MLPVLDLYATISTFESTLGGLLELLEREPSKFSTTSDASEKASVLSLLDDNKRVRGIKIYANKPTPASSHHSIIAKSEAALAPTQTSAHRFRYFAGFLPTSLPHSEVPFVFWADVYVKSASDLTEMLPATKDTVEKVRENEPDTLCYLWLRDIDDDKHMFVFEMYRSREALKVHESTEWYAEYGRKLSPFLEYREFIGAEWKGGVFSEF